MKKVEMKDTYLEETEEKSFCKIRTFKKNESETPVCISNNTASTSTPTSQTIYTSNNVVSGGTPNRRRAEVQVQKCDSSSMVSSGTPTRRRTEAQVQTCTPSSVISSGTPTRRRTSVPEVQTNFTASRREDEVKPALNRNNADSESSFSQNAQSRLSSGTPTRRRTSVPEVQTNFTASRREDEVEPPLNRNNADSESSFSQNAQSGLSSGTPTRRRTSVPEVQTNFIASRREDEVEPPLNRNNADSESSFSQNAQSGLSSGTPTRRRTSVPEVQTNFTAGRRENEVKPPLNCNNNNTISEPDFSPNTPSRLSSRTSSHIRACVPEAPSRYTLEKRNNEDETPLNHNNSGTTSESDFSPNMPSRLSSGTPTRRRKP